MKGEEAMAKILKRAGELKDKVANLANLAKNFPRDKSRAEMDKLAAEIADLKRREREAFEEIGRRAYELDAQIWDADGEIKSIKDAVAENEAKFSAAAAEREAARRAKIAGKKSNVCPSCGKTNPKEMTFCQSCGAKLAGKPACPSCGRGIPSGVPFCGYCGAKQTKQEAQAQC
jgi:hypothetical protein